MTRNSNGPIEKDAGKWHIPFRRMILQNNPVPSLDPISRELIGGLPLDLANRKASDPSWAKAILSKLQRMGDAKDLAGCYGAGDNNEWLPDILWMDPRDRRIVLAVEAAWGKPGEIEARFAKLLYVKTYRKLLLFSTTSHTGDGVVRRIEALLSAYPDHVAEEEYMAVELTESGAIRHCFKSPKNGRLESVRLIEMTPELPLPWTRRYLPMVA
jgi:hypothetical protein